MCMCSSVHGQSEKSCITSIRLLFVSFRFRYIGWSLARARRFKAVIVIACSFLMCTNVLAAVVLSSARLGIFFMFLFVVILTFYFEIISIRSILIAWEWMINVQIKNELLRRKRMSLYNFFLSIVGLFLSHRMNSIISSAERWMNWTASRPFIEQVSLFIEICISCHTILHLTKMTFHRIVLFAKHRPFTGILSFARSLATHRGG